MSDVVVSLAVHLKRTHGKEMRLNGDIVRQKRFSTGREGLRRSLEGVPPWE